MKVKTIQGARDLMEKAKAEDTSAEEKLRLYASMAITEDVEVRDTV